MHRDSTVGKRDTALCEEFISLLEEMDSKQNRINKESTSWCWAFRKRQLGVTVQTRSAPCLAQQCVPSVQYSPLQDSWNRRQTQLPAVGGGAKVTGVGDPGVL